MKPTTCVGLLFFSAAYMYFLKSFSAQRALITKIKLHRNWPTVYPIFRCRSLNYKRLQENPVRPFGFECSPTISAENSGSAASAARGGSRRRPVPCRDSARRQNLPSLGSRSSLGNRRGGLSPVLPSTSSVQRFSPKQKSAAQRKSVASVSSCRPCPKPSPSELKPEEKQLCQRRGLRSTRARNEVCARR